jgi:hypothetical protein
MPNSARSLHHRDILTGMPRKPKPQPDDPAQSKRFIDMAREIGTDESPEGRESFERAFKKVASQTDRDTTSKPKRR